MILDTRYGNAERIARSFETGLKEAGLQTVCVNVTGGIDVVRGGQT